MTELDPVIHTEARLRIVSALAGLTPETSITFPALQSVLEMTPGNLSVQLRKLEDAGYVTITKGFREPAQSRTRGSVPRGAKRSALTLTLCKGSSAPPTNSMS